MEASISELPVLMSGFKPQNIDPNRGDILYHFGQLFLNIGKTPITSCRQVSRSLKYMR